MTKQFNTKPRVLSITEKEVKYRTTYCENSSRYRLIEKQIKR